MAYLSGDGLPLYTIGEHRPRGRNFGIAFRPEGSGRRTFVRTHTCLAGLLEYYQPALPGRRIRYGKDLYSGRKSEWNGKVDGPAPLCLYWWHPCWQRDPPPAKKCRPWMMSTICRLSSAPGELAGQGNWRLTPTSSAPMGPLQVVRKMRASVWSWDRSWPGWVEPRSLPGDAILAPDR